MDTDILIYNKDKKQKIIFIRYGNRNLWNYKTGRR